MTILFGCGGGGDKGVDAAADTESPPTIPTVGKLGIAGAGSILLAPVAAARTTTPAQPALPQYRLQRVNLDGTVADVTIEDVDGNNVTSQVKVEKIVDAGTHLLFQVEVSSSAGLALTSRPVILTRKSDGAAFDVTPALPTIGCHSFLQYANVAASDDHGGVYAAIPCGAFQSENLVRFDTAASPPTATLAIPPDTHVWEFAVDPPGNIVYVAASNGSPNIYRAQSAAGQTKNLPALSGPWTGPDNLVHFIGGTTDSCASTEGCTSDLVVSGSTISVTIGAQGGMLGNFDSSKFARLPAGSDVYFVSPFGPMGQNQALTIAHWSSGQAQPVQTTWPDHTMRAAAASSTHVFVAALDATQTPVLAKFAMSDLSAAPTSVLPEGLYDIASLGASADGTLTFAGLRLSDSKQVVGRISPTGDVTISSEYTAAVGNLVPLQ